MKTETYGITHRIKGEQPTENEKWTVVLSLAKGLYRDGIMKFFDPTTKEDGIRVFGATLEVVVDGKPQT